MLQVNGAEKSGSGTIVRNAAAIAALLGEELHLFNIREKRESPGLRPQHLKALSALAQLCRGRVEGGAVGSREVWFKPGSHPVGGEYKWDIGTAGSTTMLAMTLIPAAIFAPEPVRFRVSGGLFQDFAPSTFHMKHVFFPTLGEMGVRADLRLLRPGYVPRGGGTIEVCVFPVDGALHPLCREKQRQGVKLQGIALSSHLRERLVSHRMAERCKRVLASQGYSAEIELSYDDTALQPGAALALWARTDSGYLLGADRAGAPGRPSEEIGTFVAHQLLEDLESGATVDRYLADQLVLYAALAQGTSRYRMPMVTEHLDTNLWLVTSLLGARVSLEGHTVTIEGIGYERRRD